MNIQKREKLLAYLALGVFGLFLSDLFLITPLVELWKTRAARIAELKQSISKGRSLLEREQYLRGRWDQMREKALARDRSVAANDVVKSVYQWAEASRISFTELKSDWRSFGVDYEILECRASAFGDPGEITRFLYELEKDPLAIKIEEVKVSARDERGSQLALSLRFSGLQLTIDEP